MTTVESVLIKLGIDQSEIASGLRTIERRFEEFGDKVKEGFKDKLKEWGGALSVAGIVATVERAMSKVQDIKRASENLGVSTDFIQAIQNVAGSAGLASEQVEKLMNAFTKNLAPGSDVEAEFYKLADSIASIEDPITRANMARDAFGKGGVKLVGILSQGSDAIKKFGESFAHFNEVDIANLEEAKRGLEKFENFWTVWVGRVVIGVENIARAWKATLGNRNFWTGNIPDAILQSVLGVAKENAGIQAASETERGLIESGQARTAADAAATKQWELQTKFKELEAIREQRTTRQQLREKEGEREYHEHALTRAKTDDQRLQVMDNLIRVEREIHELKKKQTEEDKRAKDLADATAKKKEEQAITEERIRFSKMQAQERSLSPYQSTIDELAQSGFWTRVGGAGGFMRWIQGPFANQAQQIIGLTQDAKAANAFGNFGRRDLDIARIKELRGQLESMGVISPEMQMQKMEEHLALLSRKASGEGGGVVTEPSNGQ